MFVFHVYFTTHARSRAHYMQLTMMLVGSMFKIIQGKLHFVNAWGSDILLGSLSLSLDGAL